ncbi:MAG: hypothetical protein J7L82_05465, partial [Staphylothermus sp.]|nr:hypothetical protein [Staphylothermus sp.]
HILYGEKGEVLEAYITDEEVDPWIFAGLYLCMFYRENSRQKAFIETFTVLSYGKGSLVKYIERIRSEHMCIHRIIQAIDRLHGRNLLDKFSFKELLLTCRGNSDSIYVVKIHKLTRGYIVESPKIINVNLNRKASSHPVNASLMCGLNEEILRKIRPENNIVVFHDKKCLLSNDPVRNIISLEKIISRSPS